MLTAVELINRYQMLLHPQGGYFKQTYRSDEGIAAAHLPARFGGDRLLSTAIYFLLEGKQFAAFHRIKSDELWHFYYGIALNIYVIHQTGELEIIKLGNNLINDENFQAVVKAGCWFASRPINENSFSFVGCTVSPEFEFAGFELAEGVELSKQYLQHKTLITSLCL